MNKAWSVGGMIGGRVMGMVGSILRGMDDRIG